MNIFGEGFPKEIVEQIKQRQKRYGSNKRTTEELLYTNNKNGWCKLVSSVDITPRTNDDGKVVDYRNSEQDRLNLMGVPLGYSGNKLAKQFVLFNGTSIQNEQGITQRAGLARDASIINSNVYGLGGLEFGLSPMPGIISAEIKTLNRGSIKESTVEIKAFNRIQFQIIDALYLRLGYPILLEWGHSAYFDNNSVYQKDNIWSISNEFLNGDLKDYFTILDKIRENRIKSNGNYDALLGKVKNFSWSFDKDGTYTITLSIISIGDVIESLNMNRTTNTLTTSIKKENDEEIEENTNSENDRDYIEAWERVNEIGRFFKLGLKLVEGTNQEELSSNGGGGLRAVALPPDNETLSTGKKSDFIEIEFDTTFTTEPDKIYVRFGTFLKFIEKYCLIYNPKGEKLNKPIIKIDYDDYNYMYTSDIMAPCDPRVCVFRKQVTIPLNISLNQPKLTKSYEIYQGKGSLKDALEPFEEIIDDVKVGNIMNIYVNCSFILNKIKENLNENGEVPLVTLLQAICDNINTSCGNKPKLTPIIDEENNIIRIIDETPLPNTEKISNYLKSKNPNLELGEEIAEFDVYGYYGGFGNNTSAGFIKDFSFKTEITPELATMITVGATANGEVVGEDATAFSKWNIALKNRITENLVDAKKLNPIPTTQNNEGTSPDVQAVAALTVDLNELLEDYNDFIDNTLWAGDWEPEEWDSYPTVLSNILSKQQSLTSKFNLLFATTKQSHEAAGASLKTGFIPFNINLTLEGLSGMKVYQQFNMDTAFLPSNYPTTFKFLIKSITHTIQDNKWETKLETMAATTVTTAPASVANFIEGTPTTPSLSSGTVSSTGRGIVRSTPPPPSELVQAMKRYNITDPKEKAHFLAQCAHESGGFRWTKEFASGQEYEGRKDLGNTQPGDGVRFKGRGYIQITGRSNYTRYNNYLKNRGDNVNILQNPELLENKYYAADSACYWWAYLSRDIRTLALSGVEPNNVSRVSTRVNGGNPANGLNDRQVKFDKYWTDLQNNPSLYS